MKMSKEQYNEYVASKAPKSKTGFNLLKSFISGGLICCVGQGILMAYEHFGLESADAKTATSVTLIFVGALLTALHVYDKLAKISGAGTLVPITGFANSVASPAIEFKSEGLITGTAAKMFVIAGPVLVFGITASAIYGVIYFLLTKL